MGKLSPNFQKVVSGAAKGEVVVPLLRAELWKPDFKGFTVKVEGFQERPYDGYFHPSVHPIQHPMNLWIYMAHPEMVVREPFDPNSTMAVTVGGFIHTFLQVVGVRAGIFEQQPEVCSCGKKHKERAEVYLVNEDTKSKGHSDGVVFDGSGLELKTMNTMKFGKMPIGTPTDKEVLDWFKDRCKDYYYQAQDYLRMGGREKMTVVIVTLQYPFEMREIHVYRDEYLIRQIEQKYRMVIQAVADRRPPECECGPFTEEGKVCSARSICLT